MKALKFNNKFADVSISEKIQKFYDFSGFCSPEFDSFLKDLAIFQLKCNEQHFSIPKSQKYLQHFHNEMKPDLQILRYCRRKNINDVIVTSVIELWQ